MTSRSPLLVALLLAALVLPGIRARARHRPAIRPAPPPAAQPEDDPDRDINFAQPDFTLAALPTTLRVPPLQERVSRDAPVRPPARLRRLRRSCSRICSASTAAPSSASSTASDSSAAPRSESTAHRSTRRSSSSDSTTSSSSATASRFGVAVMGKHRRHEQLHEDSYSPGHRRRCCRARLASTAAVYIEPFWVNNTNPLPEELVDDNDTVIIGARRAPAGPADRVLRLRSRAAGRRLRSRRRRMSVSVSRSAPAATCSSSTSRTASARRSPRSRAAASTTTTGISASTSRGSFSDHHEDRADEAGRDWQWGSCCWRRPAGCSGGVADVGHAAGADSATTSRPRRPRARRRPG